MLAPEVQPASSPVTGGGGVSADPTVSGACEPGLSRAERVYLGVGMALALLVLASFVVACAAEPPRAHGLAKFLQRHTFFPFLELFGPMLALAALAAALAWLQPGIAGLYRCAGPSILWDLDLTTFGGVLLLAASLLLGVVGLVRGEAPTRVAPVPSS